MDNAPSEIGEADDLELRARIYARVAVAFAVVSLAAGVATFSGLVGPVLRGIWFLAFPWAALTSLSFLLCANAHRERSPIRRFTLRFAVAAAVVPVVLWLGMRNPEGDWGSAILVGVAVVLVGRKAFRYHWL
jgi:hypothetical protein